ncbi:hypothetical protein PFUGPA_04640 [Plasmodium falciparum Palo Alto/Uganda]|uniref:Protein HIRA n=1 Tax=Plasmodium falciparum (isolate Palo Alto / Uganda) TaxID=57270 RepID=W4IV05_PLAFP|nr:hypothetical protein PFUGPA_04640 [Plasmodium falciparum Palo Alto/Uganda]
MPNVYLPQILWHSKDNKRSDRIYSLDIQPYPNYYSVKKLNRKYELFIKYLKEKGKIECNKFDTLEEKQKIINDSTLPSNNNYNNSSNNNNNNNKYETLKLDKELNQGNEDNIIKTVIGNNTEVSNNNLLDDTNNKLNEIKTNTSTEDHQEHNLVNKKNETNSSSNDNISHNKTPMQSNKLLTLLQDDKTKKKPIKFNIATCGADEFVHLWRIFIKDDISIKCLGRFIGHSGEINCVRFNKNGRYIASGGEDKFLYIWEKSKKPKNIPLGYDISFLDYKEWWNVVGSFRCSGVINSIIWSNNDTLYVANEDNNINIIDFVKNTNCKVQVLEGHSGIIQGISFDNNYEYLASLSADQTLKIWKKKNDGKSWKLENSIKNIRRDELDKLNNACTTCTEYDFPDKNNTDKYESNTLKQENKKLINYDLLEQEAYKKKTKNKKEKADEDEEEANNNEDVEEQQTDVGEEHIEGHLNNNIVLNSNINKMNNSNNLKMNNSNTIKMNNSFNQENNVKPYQQIHTKFMSKKHLEDGEEEQEEEEEEKKFKRSLFSSEEMLPSFFRRIDFSPNGEFLITPSGIQFEQVEKVNEKNNKTDENAKPNYEIKAYSCFYIYHKNLFLKYNIPFFTIFSQTSHFLVAKFNYNTFKLRTEQNILKRCYEHFLNNLSDVNDEDISNSNKKRKIYDDNLKLNELMYNEKLIKLNYEKTLLYNHIDIPDDVSQIVSSTISESDVEFNEDKVSLKELSAENCLMKNTERNEDGNDEDNTEENVEEKKDDIKEEKQDDLKEEKKDDSKDDSKDNSKDDSKDSKDDSKGDSKNDSKDDSKNDSKDDTKEESKKENELDINNKLNADEEEGKNDIMDKYNDNNDNVEILNEQDASSELKDKKEERFIYTLGTFDGSVYFYDSEILDIPISIVKNIHLCPITDISWNNLGNVCACSSSDGYVSFYHFNNNELGNIKSYKNYYLDKKCNDLTFDQNYFKNTFYDEVEFLNKDESNDYTSSEDEFDDHNLIPPKEETKVKRINLIVGNAANFVLSQNTKK